MGVALNGKLPKYWKMISNNLLGIHPRARLNPQFDIPRAFAVSRSVRSTATRYFITSYIFTWTLDTSLSPLPSCPPSQYGALCTRLTETWYAVNVADTTHKSKMDMDSKIRFINFIKINHTRQKKVLFPKWTYSRLTVQVFPRAYSSRCNTWPCLGKLTHKNTVILSICRSGTSTSSTGAVSCPNVAMYAPTPQIGAGCATDLLGLSAGEGAWEGPRRRYQLGHGCPQGWPLTVPTDSCYYTSVKLFLPTQSNFMLSNRCPRALYFFHLGFLHRETRIVSGFGVLLTFLSCDCVQYCLYSIMDY